MQNINSYFYAFHLAVCFVAFSSPRFIRSLWTLKDHLRSGTVLARAKS